MNKRDDLSQWSIWPPAFAGAVALAALGGLLLALEMPVWLLAGWALATAALAWLGLPRLGFHTWRDGDALCWRWGLLRHGAVRRLPLAGIAAVEVAALPDRPNRPVRSTPGVELHGGNFTPKLNRGVKLATRDGQIIWLCLPEPGKVAQALRAVLQTAAQPEILPQEGHQP
ncbi:hypothetical protein [Chitinimonas koreensis]|uniref:hypothetical protein n=1 Tax=Chitinimonas koreensis TaxID=356302 RepID=UPI000406A0BF|nr:hypothetical protein [Chitinimonas koreensis]QNM96425.1 hypothetical protein H9L41_22005 [Chitinimonas koreensis]